MSPPKSEICLMWSAVSGVTPRAPSSAGTFDHSVDSLSKYPRMPPWNRLVPRLTTKLRPAPPVCCVIGWPAVVTWIASKLS
jgi:hypothetical protein